MTGKVEIKELAKEFRELTMEMQRNSQNKSKVISYFSQIISSTEKEYQNARKNVKELKNVNNELKRELEKYTYYYRNNIKN